VVLKESCGLTKIYIGFPARGKLKALKGLPRCHSAFGRVGEEAIDRHQIAIEILRSSGARCKFPRLSVPDSPFPFEPVNQRGGF